METDYMKAIEAPALVGGHLGGLRLILRLKS